MRLDQVAAQLYTLRDHLKTPAQIASTLRKVRKMGYRAVQVSGMGPIDPEDLSVMLNDEGLLCCSTHENAATLLESPETVVERLNILGCTYTAYPYPTGIDLSNLRAVKSFAQKLNSAGRVLHESGKVLTYHNHDIEFVRIRERPILDILFAETSPQFVRAELDTHWVQAGGASPAGWCRKLTGRLPMLHMKDYAVTPNRTRVFAEIGSGNLEWGEILRAAEQSGCTWYIVEQDGDWIDNDPFKSLKKSYQFIRDRLVE